MTNIDVIEMAREAGAWSQQSKNCDVEYVMTEASLELFAALIASLIRADAIAEEREACAQLFDNISSDGHPEMMTSDRVAAAIRERSANARARSNK